MEKKQYTSPEVQAYQVNATEVICTSPVYTMKFSNDEVVQEVQNNTIQCESGSYRTTLWE